jgi:GTPase SAR1 family protein
MEIKEFKQNIIAIDGLQNNLDGRLADDLPYMLPQKNGYCFVISGSAGSGKTTLLYNLVLKKPLDGVRQSYRGLFKTILIVSPTIAADSVKKDEFSVLPPDQIYRTLDMDTLEAIEARVAANRAKGKNTLLIMDDVGSQLKKNKKIELKLKHFVMNRRHSFLSCFFLVQKYNDIPAAVRENMSHIAIFRPKTQRERDSITDELLSMKKNVVNKLFEYLYRDEEHDRYVFLYIDMSLQHSSRFLFYKNFNRLEITNQGEKI